MNYMSAVAEGFEKKWDSYFEEQEAVRIRNLFGSPPTPPEVDTTPLGEHLIRDEGKTAGGKVEIMSRILKPHSDFKGAVSQLEMLFRHVDVEGDRRKAAAREVRERKEEERRVERRRRRAMGLKGMDDEADRGDVGVEIKLKWWQKMEGAEEGGNKVKGKGKEEEEGKDFKPFAFQAFNHRTFHYVLHCNREGRKRDRDLRLATHENKRAVSKELLRFIWERDR